jgi:hypothetical protein
MSEVPAGVSGGHGVQRAQRAQRPTHRLHENLRAGASFRHPKCSPFTFEKTCSMGLWYDEQGQAGRRELSHPAP